MQLWAVLELAFGLATAISCIALIIGELHVIEKVEEQKWKEELRKSAGTVR